MARPARAPRLSRCDPEAIAVDVAERRHWPEDGPLPTRQELLATPIAVVTSKLVDYARTGVVVAGDSPDEFLRRVCRSSYGCEPERAPAQLATPLGVVVLAARGRLEIALRRRGWLRPSEVAALAGVHPNCLYDVPGLYFGRGAILVDRARRWLIGRGVPGL